MTPDEQLREWDARIAVAFFGWRWVRWPKGNPLCVLFPPEHLAREHHLPCNHSTHRARGWDHFGLPRFTTDPAAATMLWDKIREVSTVSDVSASADGFVFDISFGHQQRVSAEGKTWMLALCKAALAMAEATGAKGATV